jgi:hypothetical protein
VCVEHDCDYLRNGDQEKQSNMYISFFEEKIQYVHCYCHLNIWFLSQEYDWLSFFFHGEKNELVILTSFEKI